MVKKRLRNWFPPFPHYLVNWLRKSHMTCGVEVSPIWSGHPCLLNSIP